MKSFCPILACTSLIALAGCAGQNRNPAPAMGTSGSAIESPVVAGAADADDSWDDSADVAVSDPIEPVNRGSFWLNHQIYQFVLKPVSETYKFLFPETVRRGIFNAYDNVRFPVRLVNHTLQARFDRAALETGKFLVNTTVGVGGVMTPADKFPALAGVPKADTGQTLAKWGLGHGAYLVVPVVGPSSARDLVGLAGDTALNPVSWLGVVFGGAAWTLAVTTPAGVRSLPDQMDQYDTVTKAALDRYLAARTAYIQHRNAVTKRDSGTKQSGTGSNSPPL